MISFFVYLGLMIVMFVGVIAGISSGSAGLILPWLCLSVPFSIALGRASVRALPKRRIAFVDEQTYQAIQRRRTG
ncbi:MAG: hypothetical protein SF162_07590 [bacterium]|nr:hypothetical protein [bacterium]